MLSAAGFASRGLDFNLTDYGKNAHLGEAPPTAKARRVFTKRVLVRIHEDGKR